MSTLIFFLLKNTFKVALQYLSNVFILFKTVSYFKLNFKLKIDHKMCTFKSLEEIWKTWKKFGKPGKNLEKTVKKEWQPCEYTNLKLTNFSPLYFKIYFEFLLAKKFWYKKLKCKKKTNLKKTRRKSNAC